MPILVFPDPNESTPEGIVALGGDLHPETLLAAYRKGIFPWPISGMPLAWFCPPARAILEFKDLHIPRTLIRAKNKALAEGMTWTMDRSFEQVITRCAKSPRPGQKGTWITAPLKKAYIAFHRQGYAHSVEAWDRDGQLVGGIYGVLIDGVFSAESMFYQRTGASKLALLYLIEQLKARGLKWMDIQMLTPHMERLGAKEIPRAQFLALLKESASPLL